MSVIYFAYRGGAAISCKYKNAKNPTSCTDEPLPGSKFCRIHIIQRVNQGTHRGETTRCCVVDDCEVENAPSHPFEGALCDVHQQEAQVGTSVYFRYYLLAFLEARREGLTFVKERMDFAHAELRAQGVVIPEEIA